MADIKAFLALARSGATPRGRVVLTQSAADPLAYHEDSPEHLGFILEAVDWLDAPRRFISR